MASVEQDQLRDVQRMLEKLNIRFQKLSGDASVPLFKEYAEKYLSNKLQNPTLRDSTKRSFRHSVRQHLIPAFGEMPIDKVNNAEFLKWVTRTRETFVHHPNERKLRRFFNARKALAEILLAAHREGLIERAPKLDNPDEARNVGRTLTQEEVLAILRKASRPFRFIFYTFWKTGFRPREILKWEWDMFRWNEGGRTWLDVPARISKTDRTRSVPLPGLVAKILAIRSRRKRGSKFVFPAQVDPSRPQLTYHAAWATALRHAGIPHAVPYDFRRTFITNAAASGKPLLYVAKCLDTSTKMIEGIYAKAQAQVMEEIMS